MEQRTALAHEPEQHHQLDAVEREDSERLHPEVWIGTAEDYHQAREYGAWIDVARREPEVVADINAVLERTPGGLGQQWGMFEARGFGYWHPTCQDSLAVVMTTARRILQHGLPYSALVEALGADSLAVQSDRYRLSFIGEWPSLEAFARQVAADSGWYDRLEELPLGMRRYAAIDIGRLMQDAEHDLTVVEHPGGVWVFDPRVW